MPLEETKDLAKVEMEDIRQQLVEVVLSTSTDSEQVCVKICFIIKGVDRVREAYVWAGLYDI